MKKLAIVISLVFFGTTSTYAQTIPCSNFTITGSYPDTLNPNDYQISINFNAGSNEIVNYPYISAILDCNGDTVAIGGLFYFAQLGQTTQDYPVTLVDTSSWCDPLTAVFIYGSGPLNEEDTCLFTFQTASITGITEVEKNQVFFYPNPVNDKFIISVTPALIGESFRIIDELGKVVKMGELNALKTEVLMSGIESGIYSVNIGLQLAEKIIVK
jgi:hypothetical protein